MTEQSAGMTDLDARLDLTVVNAVATVTITNPAKRNAMTAAMWRDLPPLLDRLAADPAVRVVVLTGAGAHFCAGADLTDLTELRDNGGGSLTTVAEAHLAAFPKPTIARISGYCVGGGCQLAVACDLRFAGSDALIGVPPAKLGIVYPAATTRRLVELIGPSAAKFLLFSADPVDAARAAAIGLVDEIVPAAGLADRVAAFAATVASRSQLTIAAAKEIVAMAGRGGVDADRMAYWHREAVTGPDAAEGVAAFAERRAPEFTWSWEKA
jgi:enoyl-CoA hydratase/carnithine racemase